MVSSLRNSRLLIGTALLGLFVIAKPACGQAPGTAIETSGTLARDRELLKQAAALLEGGKLLGVKEIHTALEEPLKTLQLELPAPNTRRLPNREIANRARAALVRVGWYARRHDDAPWELLLSGGYALTPDGVIATCYHCVTPLRGMETGYLVAVDSQRKVHAVTALLSAHKRLDACLLKIEASQLAYLPLQDHLAVGDDVFCFSDPFDQLGYFSNGIVNRFFRLGKGKAAENTLESLQHERINVSTAWAPGSSGAAVLDAAGNAIGHVSRIRPYTLDGPPAEEEGKEPPAETPRAKKKRAAPPPSGPTAMVTHEAIPARGVLALAGALGKPRQPASTTIGAATIRPAQPAPTVPAAPKEPTLTIGSPAPKLQVSKWVQGEAVAAFDKDHAYIVEFWATWCGPCRTSIPHLNELHKQFVDKGLIVIGQDCWERDLEKVDPFLKEMGDKMSYRVALDDTSEDEKGAMARNWMEAAGQSGIPTAFIIDKQQRVAWIGHPMELTESLLESVLAGSYDIELAKKEYEERQRFLAIARKASLAISVALRAQKPEDAVAPAEELLAAAPPKMVPTALFTRLRVAMAAKDATTANEVLRKIDTHAETKSMTRNQAAWMYATAKDIDGLDRALAEKLAEAATVDGDNNSRAAALDTLARLLYLRGDRDGAIARQKAAIELSDGPRKASLEATLKKYEEDKLPDADE